MELKQFEDKINKKFQDHQPTIDGDQIWNSIQGKIPQEKKRRPFFWIFSGMILIFIIGGILGLSIGKYGSGASQISSSSTLINDHSELKSNVNKASINNSQVDSANDDSIVNTEQNIQANEDVKVSTIDGNQQINDPIKEELKTTNVAKNEFSFQHQKSTNKHLTDQANNSFLKYDASSTDLYSSDDLRFTTIESEDKFSNGKGSTFTKTINIAKEPSQVLSFVPQVPAIPSMELNSFSMDNSFQFSPIVNPTMAIVKADNKIRNEFVKSNIIRVYTAYSTFVNSANEDLNVVRNGSIVKPLENIGIGVDYAFELNKNWSLGLGLEYNLLQEEHQYSTYRTEDFILPDVITQIVYSASGVQSNSGDVTVDAVIETKMTRYNKHQSVQLPVFVQFQTPLGKGIDIYSRLGLETMVFSSISGYEKRVEQEIDLSRSKIYKKNFTFSGLALIGIAKHWNSHWSIRLDFQYKLGLNNIIQEQNDGQLRRNLSGLNLGCQYNF